MLVNILQHGGTLHAKIPRVWRNKSADHLRSTTSSIADHCRWWWKERLAEKRKSHLFFKQQLLWESMMWQTNRMGPDGGNTGREQFTNHYFSSTKVHYERPSCVDTVYDICWEDDSGCGWWGKDWYIVKEDDEGSIWLWNRKGNRNKMGITGWWGEERVWSIIKEGEGRAKEDQEVDESELLCFLHTTKKGEVSSRSEGATLPVTFVLSRYEDTNSVMEKEGW